MNSILNKNLESENVNYSVWENIPENNMQQNNVIKNMYKNNNNMYASKNVNNINNNMVTNTNKTAKKQLTYEDILKKMGMFVKNGQLYLLDEIQKPPQKKEEPTYNNTNLQNHYIYNKYFSKEINKEPDIKRPQNIIEYRNMLIQNIIQKEKIKRIKSKKLIIPEIVNAGITKSMSLVHM